MESIVRLNAAVAFMLLLPAISACSGLPGGKADGPAPLFRTHINQEGSKRFTFEAAPLDTLPTLPQQDGLGLRHGNNLLERRDALQDVQLTRTLAERNYCREGYIVLSQTSWKIRGECNETATQADRRAFPNRASWQD